MLVQVLESQCGASPGHLGQGCVATEHRPWALSSYYSLFTGPTNMTLAQARSHVHWCSRLVPCPSQVTTESSFPSLLLFASFSQNLKAFLFIHLFGSV